jgi:hypothetical protein
MRGYSHGGLVTEGICSQGHYDPSITKINYAVPSEKTLLNHKPAGGNMNIGKAINPGLIEQNVETYANAHSQTSNNLSFDGKFLDQQTLNCLDMKIVKSQQPGKHMN